MLNLSLDNISLDINFVRSQFPSFKDPLCKDWSFFENAGGSYVPKSVIDRLTNFMISTKVQPYAEYSMSKIAGEQMDQAIRVFAHMINAKENEILIGGSTSNNLYVLSNALKKFIEPGDEIIVTNQDHEANITPWRRLKDIGGNIREWKLNPLNGELEFNKLEELLNNKTKILAVTHCSNIVGSINDLNKISDLAHKHNVIVIGDGVSFAPHGLPDVKDLKVDFYAFSLYKTYGPHIGLLYGKEEILSKLPNQNHEYLEGKIPYNINPGGPNHEELVSIIGIYEYFMDLYNHHYDDDNATILEKIFKVNILISNHEEKIANLFLDYINSRNEIRLIGKKKIENKNRAPTISFTLNNMSSNNFSKLLVKDFIATRNDNFYAWRCLKALGIDTDDGVIRISMTHYNSISEVEKLIKSIDGILNNKN